MEQKTKLIIIGLGLLLATSIFIAFQTVMKADNFRRERDEAKAQMDSINQKFGAAIQGEQKLKERIDLLISDLNKLTQEKEQIRAQSEEIVQQKNAMQSKYEAIAKERDELVEKLKTQTQAPAPQKEQKPQGEQPAPTQDAYWAGVLKDKTELSIVTENMRSELSALRIKNDQLNKDLISLGREKEEIEQQLNYNQKMFDSMASELVLERNAKRTLQENSKSLKNENMLLRRQLKSLNNRQAELEIKLIKIQSEKVEIERRFNEMADVLEDRLSKVTEIRQQLENVRRGSGGQINIAPEEKTKESVELAPIVVRPGQLEKYATPEGKLATLSGRVLEINKENNFVIIDIGQDSAVKVGDAFQVYNMEGKPIANVEVIQVRPKISACDIKKETTPIVVGDTVR